MSSSASSTNVRLCSQLLQGMLTASQSSIVDKSATSEKKPSKSFKALKSGFDFSFKNTRKPATQPSKVDADAVRHFNSKAASQHTDLDVVDYFVGKSDSWHIAGSACRTQ
jgi:hypothetical protein